MNGNGNSDGTENLQGLWFGLTICITALWLDQDLDDPALKFLRDKNFSFSQRPNWMWDSTHPPIKWALRSLYRGLSRPARYPDHLLPSTIESKNEWSCASSPLVLFRVLYMYSFAIYRCTSAGEWFEVEKGVFKITNSRFGNSHEFWAHILI